MVFFTGWIIFIKNKINVFKSFAVCKTTIITCSKAQSNSGTIHKAIKMLCYISTVSSNYSICRTVKPLLTKDEFAVTEQVAKNFGAPGGVGEKLQLMLEEKGAKEPNWVNNNFP